MYRSIHEDITSFIMFLRSCAKVYHRDFSVEDTASTVDDHKTGMIYNSFVCPCFSSLFSTEIWSCVSKGRQCDDATCKGDLVDNIIHFGEVSIAK